MAGGLALLLLSQAFFGSEFSTRAAARLVAPFIGMAYQTGSRDRISVLLIDQASLEVSKEQWPVRYGYYADLVETIAQDEPTAIFLDLFLVDRRNDPSLPALVAMACEVAGKGIPVLVGADADLGSARLRPELMEARTSSGKHCFTDVGVSYTSDRFDRVAWSYPARVDHQPSEMAGSSDELGSDHYASAAFRLYDSIAAAPGSTLPAAKAHEIALVWGTISATSPLQMIDAEQVPAADGRPAYHCRKLGGNGWETMSLLVPSNPPACAFHETTMAWELRGPDADARTRLHARFHQRTVMIGTMLAGTGDFINSPVNGRIPGVYLHAMALDNLLTYRGDGKRVVEVLHGHLPTAAILELLLIAAIFAIVLAATQRWIDRLVDVLGRKMPMEHAVEAEAPERDPCGRWKTILRHAKSRALLEECKASLGRGLHLLPIFLLFLVLKTLRLLAALLVAAALMAIAHAWLNIGVLFYIEVVVGLFTAHLLHVGGVLRHPLRHGFARELYDHQPH